MPARADPLPAHADVLVVGGGVVGVSSAWFLAERGARVVLVEKGGIASGCSYGNAGWIFSSHAMPLPRPGALREALRWLAGIGSRRTGESPLYIRPRLDAALAGWLWRFARSCNEAQMRRAARVRRELGLRSQALYAKLARRPDLDFGFAQRGLLVVCETQAALARATAELRLLEELGGRGRLVTGDALRALAPSVGPEAAGGVFHPDDAHVDPARFVTALARDAERRGVCVATDAAVLAIATAGGRVTGAITSRGEIRCERLVLATGSWSPGLLRPLGLSLPVQPAKGHSVTANRPGGAGDVPLLLADAHVAVTPLGERLRVAGTLELAGLDLAVDPRRVQGILNGVRRQLPGLGPIESFESWCGLRPLSPDDLPIVGAPARHPNLVLATGHGTNGMCHGPASGELVAQLVAGERPELDFAPLSPDRF